MHQLLALVTIAALSCVAALGCGGPDATSPGAMRTISGRVTESPPTDTIPVPGARVTINDGPNGGRTATAGADGRYSLTGLADSTFSLGASAAGYQTRSGSLILGEDRALDFQLFPEPQSVTDTVDGALEVSTCNGDTYITCFTHTFDVHHTGNLEFRLTTSAQTNAMYVILYSVTYDSTFSSWEHLRSGVLARSFGTRPAGRYEVRLVTRVANRVPFRLELGHPK